MSEKLFNLIKNEYPDIYIKVNTDLNLHLEFIGWIFDPNAEHNMGSFLLFFLLKNEFKITNLFRHEIVDINLKISDGFLKINYKIADDNFMLMLKIYPNQLECTSSKQLVTIQLKDFFIKYIHNMYTIVSGYQAKKIIRIFINESKLFENFIYEKSYKALSGKKYFQKYLLDTDTSESFALKLLYESGETLDYHTICALQDANPSLIYGSIFNKHSFDTYGYKLTYAKKKKANILTIGSSRAHFFKEHFFKNSFYNTSYTMTYLQEGIKFIKELLKETKPKLIIISLEFWWFHPDHYGETEFLPLHSTHNHFDTDYINKLFEYIYDQQLTLEDINHIKNRDNFKSQNNPYFGIGLRAAKTGEGYLNNGYYWYANAKHSPGLIQDKNICTEMIDNNFFHFKKSNHFSTKKFKLFESFIDLCHKNSIEVISILTPFSDQITNRLVNYPDYRYVSKLIDAFNAQNKYEFYNFINASNINSPASEFYDCYHGGDITYARILHKILENKSSLLHKYCSVTNLEDIIEKNKYNIAESSLFTKG